MLIPQPAWGWEELAAHPLALTMAGDGKFTIYVIKHLFGVSVIGQPLDGHSSVCSPENYLVGKVEHK